MSPLPPNSLGLVFSLTHRGFEYSLSYRYLTNLYHQYTSTLDMIWLNVANHTVTNQYMNTWFDVLVQRRQHTVTLNVIY